MLKVSTVYRVPGTFRLCSSVHVDLSCELVDIKILESFKKDCKLLVKSNKKKSYHKIGRFGYSFLFIICIFSLCTLTEKLCFSVYLPGVETTGGGSTGDTQKYLSESEIPSVDSLIRRYYCKILPMYVNVGTCIFVNKDHSGWGKKDLIYSINFYLKEISK